MPELSVNVSVFCMVVRSHARIKVSKTHEKYIRVIAAYVLEILPQNCSFSLDNSVLTRTAWFTQEHPTVSSRKHRGAKPNTKHQSDATRCFRRSALDYKPGRQKRSIIHRTSITEGTMGRTMLFGLIIVCLVVPSVSGEYLALQQQFVCMPFRSTNCACVLGMCARQMQHSGPLRHSPCTRLDFFLAGRVQFFRFSFYGFFFFWCSETLMSP